MYVKRGHYAALDAFQGGFVTDAASFVRAKAVLMPLRFGAHFGRD
jgi:hypothetical protein